MDLFSLITKGLLFGIALAMDAFSVSLANGLHDSGMCRRRAIMIAGTFSVFQAAMPLIGWFLIHTALQYFNALGAAIPYIALVLLCFIGGKMIYDAIKEGQEEKALAGNAGIGIAGNTGIADESNLQNEAKPPVKDDCTSTVSLGFGALIVQGIATSIDALSVGFDIAHLTAPEALIEAAVIAAVTFVICIGGVYLGKKFGTKLAGSATALGGVILIAIGFEIFISSFFK
ncbi:MAG: manganese efflux pump [Clostridia bacterium]|nr:manganese efflux pump [Clostridia bacterium]